MIPIRDDIPSSRPPFAGWLLIAANVATFVALLQLPPRGIQHAFMEYGLVPARLGSSAEAWLAFLTSIFLHGGWLHLIGNLWTLWIFGDNVEDRMGSLRFLAFYLVCGLAAGAVHSLTNPGASIPAVGASGAIAGVLGAYFVLFPLARVLVLLPILIYPLFFELPAVLYLGLWFLMQFSSGTASLGGPQSAAGIAWWAHIGGFAAGILLHRLFLARSRQARPRPFL